MTDDRNRSISDYLPIAVRAYVPTKNLEKKQFSKFIGLDEPSEWVLIFDTETTTDTSQNLRFGVYQFRCGSALREKGIFYNPSALNSAEIALLKSICKRNNLEFRSRTDFIENVFFGMAYEFRATIVGFNLPFDLSRLAFSHSPARRSMRGGFSFALSKNSYWPNVQIKHLSRRAALIQFAGAGTQKTARGARRRKIKTAVRRGFFVDLKTLAAALTSQNYSLGSLAEFLETPNRKQETEKHGEKLTEQYVYYAIMDVQVTWECFQKLKERYSQHGLTKTPPHRVFSEASLGKAYLKEMGIKTWRELQPDFPPEMIGHILSTYFGGRSEVRIRREIAQVLYCDFLSMYPTICCLMGIWNWVTAQGVEYRDATREAKVLLERITIADLQYPGLWPQLATLVQVKPDGEIFPVRAAYENNQYYTIGLNRLSSDQTFWFTLADCLAAKFLSGKTPYVVSAMSFWPKPIQEDLKPVAIIGNPEYLIDPTEDDFFKRLIDLRTKTKERKKTVLAAEAEILDVEQMALKILANSTSYGISVEINVEERAGSIEAPCYGPGNELFTVKTKKVEKPGTFFHPLLGTFVTAGARLMLAITESLAKDRGLDWAYCDTDSFAFAKPVEQTEREFLKDVEDIREWFVPLNPYESRGSLLKIEDANYRRANGKPTKELDPLYCFCVSAKRVALFNVDDCGTPILRKASGHGLGHLVAPYQEGETSSLIPAPAVPLKELGVERWQYDFWYRIVQAALSENAGLVITKDLPHFDQPAAIRYSATTPELLRWFKSFNESKPKSKQVWPFNFLYLFLAERETFVSPFSQLNEGDSNSKPADSSLEIPRPISPYQSSPIDASKTCFDRDSGLPVKADRLKSYANALTQYHFHPEVKFLNGDFVDRGTTERRHVFATSANLIGKEANKWEEQFYLGLNPEDQPDYGLDQTDRKLKLLQLRQAAKKYGVSKLAKAAGISRQHLSSILKGKSQASNRVIVELEAAAKRFANIGKVTA